MSSELPDPVLRLGDRGAPVHHSPGELEHHGTLVSRVDGRFHEFVLYAFRHAPQTAQPVGHALVHAGLEWDETEPFVLFYTRAVELLEREGATKRPPEANGSHEPEARARRGRRARGPGD
jgi:hypothetical protein